MFSRISSGDRDTTGQSIGGTHLVLRLSRAGVVRDIVGDGTAMPVPEGASWVGRTLDELTTAEDAGEIRRLIGEAIDYHRLTRFSGRLGEPLGPRDYEVWLMPSGPDSVQAFFADVTGQRQSAQETLRLNRALLALQSAASAVSLSLDVEHVLDTFCWELTEMLDAAGTAVFSWDDQANRLNQLASHHRERCPPFAEPFEASQDRFAFVRHVLAERYARQLSLGLDSHDLPEHAYMRENEIETLILMPMIFQDRTIGLVLLVGGDADQIFPEQEISLAQLLTNQAAAAVANAQLHHDTEQRLKAQTVLREASELFSASLDRQTVLNDIAEQMCRTMEATSAYIRTFEPNQPTSTVVTEYVSPQASEREKVPALGTTDRHDLRVRTSFQAGQPVVLQLDDPALADIERERLSNSGARSVLAVPMLRGGLVVAVAEVWESRRRRRFSQGEIDLAQGIAQIAAVALENANLYQRARREIAERERAEAALEQERSSLAERVAEQTFELRRANAELARAARLKDEFLASMSHELRTPLNAILGIAEGMADQLYGPLNERQIRSLHLVEQSGRHLLALIDDILDVSKIESGQLTLDLSLVPVAATCNSCLQLIRQTANDKSIRVSFSKDDAVTHMRADQRRLKQILINLLSNAVKFTPDNGEIGLEVRGEPEQNLVHLTVWDKGIGIAEADVGRLFRPFVQLDSSLARRYNGTGLGLALVKRLAEMHQGSVRVESKVNEGSRFTVTLPWRAADLWSADTAGLDDEMSEALRAPDELNGSSSPDDRPLILLAEDDDINAEVFVSCIRSMDYRVIVARDGHEAVRRAREDLPALILMDIQMPGLSGLDAIREIRRTKELAGVPIIALTALAMIGDREKCLEAGASDYVSKPVPLRKLRSVISAHMDGRSPTTWQRRKVT